MLRMHSYAAAMLQLLLSKQPTEGIKCGRSTCCREMQPLLCRWASDEDRSADPAFLAPYFWMMPNHLLVIISLVPACTSLFHGISITPAFCLCCILNVQANGKATICQCQYWHSPTRMIPSGGEQVLSHLAGLHDHPLISTQCMLTSGSSTASCHMKALVCLC